MRALIFQSFHRNRFGMVRRGGVDLALADGAEASIIFADMKAWEALRDISPDVCRPFSKDRRGMILGEGAGVVILEDMDRAKARGATIYAELAGFGITPDAMFLAQPRIQSWCLRQRRCMAMRPAPTVCLN